ncbi:hypothetical protein EPI10_003635 [Gossypium australe]|uniref:Uncharacterized protein n=1 Tax=Gossypium australe TaxID=47621 RepID=A0A5B6UL52_9ROSI|nr:hypothetical protein EPI10_003635 [Gossypium australe]
MMGKNTVLGPLSPQQVTEDQQRLRQSMETSKEKIKNLKEKKEKKLSENNLRVEENESEEKGKEKEKKKEKKKKSEKNKSEKESERKKRDKKKCVSSPKELHLKYLPEERRFVMQENDPKIHMTKGKHGLISKNSMLNLSKFEEIGKDNEFGEQIYENEFITFTRVELIAWKRS